MTDEPFSEIFGEGGGVPNFDIQAVMMMASSNLVTATERGQNEIKPTPEQYALMPGDVGFLCNTGAVLENGLSLVRMLDVMDFAFLFPDYGDRIQNGFILVAWRTPDDRLGDIGWVSRNRFIPLPAEVYQKWSDRLDDPEFVFDKDDTPDLDEAFHRHNKDHIKVNDLDVELVECEQCGTTNVKVDVVHTVFISTQAGWEMIDGKKKLVKSNNDKNSCTLTCKMNCKVCGWSRDIDPEEFAGNLHDRH